MAALRMTILAIRLRRRGLRAISIHQQLFHDGELTTCDSRTARRPGGLAGCAASHHPDPVEPGAETR
jgi:hypothetical protein